LYFAVTTLTTVGLGDIVPKSNSERLLIAFAMLIGVAIFSYFLAELGDMIFIYSKHHEIINHSDLLYKFFGVLRNFNYNEPIEETFIEKIENYFKYRWNHWKNYVFTEEFEGIWMQIPDYTLD